MAESISEKIRSRRSLPYMVSSGENLVEGERVDVRLEMRELLAVFGRENLERVESVWPDLDEAQAEPRAWNAARWGYALEA